MGGILYIRGDLITVTGTIKPGTSENWAAIAWGAGAASYDDGSGGWAGSFAKKNSLAVVSGVTQAFSLGPPGQVSNAAGGDAWLSTNTTLFASGGNNFVTNYGDTLYGSGNPGNITGGSSRAGGAGAPGPAGVSPGSVTSSNNDTPGGGGGGSNLSGGVGTVASTSNGGTGGAGTGVGGVGGNSTTLVGGNGGQGAGGGGGFSGNGGNGGDDWDNGGGGGGGAAQGTAVGGNGGTPGGGAGGCNSGQAWGRAGYSLLRITYGGAQPTITITAGSPVVVFSTVKGLFHGGFSDRLAFPSPTLLAALAPLALGRAIERNRMTTRRRLLTGARR